MTQPKNDRERSRIERELRQIAFANAADYVEILDSPDEGRLVRVLPSSGIKARQLAALAVIKEGKNGVEIKLKDSLKALELLCKLRGLLVTDKKQSGGDNLEELLEGLRELDSPLLDEEENDDL